MVGYRFGCHPGCVGGVTLHQFMAAVQFHNPSRCAANTSLRKMSSVYVKGAGGGLKLWGSDIWTLAKLLQKRKWWAFSCNYC